MNLKLEQIKQEPLNKEDELKLLNQAINKIENEINQYKLQ